MRGDPRILSTRDNPGLFQRSRERAQWVKIGLTDGHPQERRDTRQNLRITRQQGGRNGFGILPATHQAGYFVGFHEAVHAQPQAELIAVFARAEVSPGADRKAAESFSAELASSPVHFGSIIGVLPFNCYANGG